MDTIYTKLWGNYGQGLYILTKKCFHLSLLLRHFISIWLRGQMVSALAFHAGGRGLIPGACSFQDIFWHLESILVCKKLNFKRFLNPFSLHEQRL